MEIGYTPDQQDLLQSALDAMQDHKGVERRAKTTYGICAFFVGLLLYATFGKQGLSLAAVLCGAASSLLLLAAFPLLVRLMLRRHVKKLAGQESGRQAMLPRTVSLSGQVLKIKGETFQKVYPLDAIKRVERQREYLQITAGKEGTFSIPLRIFESEDQRRRFIDELSSRAGK
ncbi:MAG: hypothetical protein GXX99_06480 [Clostridiales bacterium]|nr:hypothetical protein [Clostridiales bacterium]